MGAPTRFNRGLLRATGDVAGLAEYDSRVGGAALTVRGMSAVMAATTFSDPNIPRIREEVLRDPRYPGHAIVERPRPFLQVRVEQFRPERVILFGSYANGMPGEDSDVERAISAGSAAL